ALRLGWSRVGAAPVSRLPACVSGGRTPDTQRLMESLAVSRTWASPATFLAFVFAFWPTLGRSQTTLQTRIYASGFTAPVAFVQDPTDRTVQFVLEQSGRIRVVRDGLVLPTDFLDLTSVVLSGGE